MADKQIKDLTAKATVSSTDQLAVDDAANATKKVTGAQIAAYVASAIDTDDISEGDNKFVTASDITVLGNTSGTNTGDQDLSALATKANVLELDNTTSFTPDADYEPATKKYVDDNAGGSSPITTKGDLIVGDSGGSDSRIAVGTNDYVLTADSSEASGVKWAAGGSGGGGIGEFNGTEALTVTGTNALAAGIATATATDTVAIGYNATASQNDAIAIGNATSSSYGSVAIGNTTNVTSTSYYGIAIGDTAIIQAERGIAIGQNSKVTADHGIAMGQAATVPAARGLSLGYFSDVNAGHTDSVALGANSQTSAANQIMLGNTITTSVTTNASATIAVTNDNDLVTKKYVDDNAASVSTGTTAPSSTPSKAGDIFVDTTGGNVYIAKGSASSADWVQVNN